MVAELLAASGHDGGFFVRTTTLILALGYLCWIARSFSIWKNGNEEKKRLESQRMPEGGGGEELGIPTKKERLIN